jgi:simple sugar transport system permease protein
MSSENTETRTLALANSRLDATVRGLIGRAQGQGSTVRMLVILVASFAFFTALQPAIFLNPVNLQNIAVASPEIGVISIAMMLAMLTGGIDLSLVAIANLSAITITTLYSQLALTDPEAASQAMPFIVLLGIVVGLVAGAFNGFLISRLGITPILATLGTMQIYNGIAIVWTGGSTLYGAPEALTAIGDVGLLNVPSLFIMLLVIAGAVGMFLKSTSLGRKALLLGTNPVAAKYSGINSRNVLMNVYVLGGGLGGLAGILFLVRNPTASAEYGSSYVLLAIVIAVLGGTNPAGGFATVWGVVLATITLQVVFSGFTAMRLSAYEYSLTQGLILIAVMVIDQLSAQRRQNRGLGKRKPLFSRKERNSA